MKRIKLFEEFNADMPMQDMIKMELKKELLLVHIIKKKYLINIIMHLYLKMI
jgi:hypothetical protein